MAAVEAALLGVASANLTANVEAVEATERHGRMMDERLARVEGVLVEILEVLRGCKGCI
jgi:hypothetical protein